MIRLSFMALGFLIGGAAMWIAYRHRPTVEQLVFTNRLYQAKAEEYKALCQDCLTGLDLIGHYVASLQLSSPNDNQNKIIDAISSLQKSIIERGADSHALTPFHETNPFTGGTG
jgi:hypothetical protein